MDTPRTLTSLRDEIADVDRALLELLRRRLDLAADVGRLKAEAALPVVVLDVEDRILTRARAHAEACGVSEDVMAAIFQAIIRSSVERQYRVGVELRARRGLRVLVVGGAGAMGSWLRSFFEVIGHHVDIVDPALATMPAAAGRIASAVVPDDLSRGDAVVVSVPLGLTPAVLDDVLARRPPGLVVEIASIKDHVLPVLTHARNAGLRVAALHPMFGPGKSLYEPMTFVLACLDDPADERARLEPLLRHPYTHVVAVPLAHHDRLMGWLLGLAHLTGMLFGAALSRSGLEPEELRACASTTFTRQAATALSVLSEDPDLYLDIQRLNPHRGDVYAAARQALADLSARVEAGDREGFRGALTAARRAVGDEG